jgi:hypothetical protein
MKETSGSKSISTKLERIAKMARSMPGVPLSTLAHHMDIEWLHEAYRRTRKDGGEFHKDQAEEFEKFAALKYLIDGNADKALEIYRHLQSDTFRSMPNAEHFVFSDVARMASITQQPKLAAEYYRKSNKNGVLRCFITTTDILMAPWTRFSRKRAGTPPRAGASSRFSAQSRVAT